MKEIYRQLIQIQRRRYNAKFRIYIIILIAISIALYLTNIFNFSTILHGVPALLTIFQEMFPPDFGNSDRWVKPCIDSILMSISSTFIALIIAVPLSLIAARNIFNIFFISKSIRLFLNLFRAIPDIVLGIIIVAAVGFGSISGTLAIAIHSIGMLGKFISESIERTNQQVTNVVESTGASKFQIIFYGIFPQIYQELIDLVMYRWEYNFRQSTIMGIVGAGGIGLELILSLRLMQYQEVFAILIIIVLLVTVVDILSYIIRNSSRKL